MNRVHELPPPEYEADDASPVWIVTAVGALTIAIALTLLAAAWLYSAHNAMAFRAAVIGREGSFRNGSLQRTSIARDWSEQDRLVHDHLATYGWIDREAGIVRIPIERAMELTAGEPSKEAK